MKLSECLIEKAMVVQTSVGDKREILAGLVALIEQTDGVMDSASLLDEVEQREELGSTGIGKGVAIPHVHLKNVSELHVAMMTSAGGVDFGAIDDEPCRIFIMVVAPDSSREAYLQLLAEVSRLFREDTVRDGVLAAGTPSELLEVLRNAETK
ncbi:MAG: PTS sugar transporter subunit IIA [Planctomycetota bacterium]